MNETNILIIKIIAIITIVGIMSYYPVTDTMEYRNNMKNDYIISTEDCIILECRRAPMFSYDRLLIECNGTKNVIRIPNMLDYYIGQNLTKITWNYKLTEYK